MSDPFARREQEREKARTYVQKSIAEIESKLGDDQDWVRCRRLIQRAIKHLNHDWALLPLMPYKEYLNTAHWERMRGEAMKRAGYRCQVCNSKDCELHTHHRTYEHLGNEKQEDLIVLCEPCHTTFHKHRELAAINQDSEQV
jgi:hypothetical protein